MNIAIIEDEKLLQDELIEHLSFFSDINIVKCIDSVNESISWLQNNMETIDLIFMDIELSDGVCFEIFESLDIQTPIIFLTAYSEYAIKAFKVNSIDFLLKPINSNDLSFALNKYKTKYSQKKIDISLFKKLYAKVDENTTTRFLINSGDNYKYVATTDIAYFLSEDKYTTVVTFDNKKHIIDKSLNTIEELISTEQFYRPSRNIIVNIKAIIRASKYFNSRLKLHINPLPNIDIIVSRTKAPGFLKWMGNIDAQ